MWLQCLTVLGILLITAALTHVKTWEVSSVVETWDWKVVFKVDLSNNLHGHGLVVTPKLCPAPGHRELTTSWDCPLCPGRISPNYTQAFPGDSALLLVLLWEVTRTKQSPAHSILESSGCSKLIPEAEAARGRAGTSSDVCQVSKYGRLGRVSDSPSYPCQPSEPLLSLRTLFIWSVWETHRR